ncbi:hypothetical protein ACXZ1K_07790 [Pedobacter sp. PWIIR3]
MNKHLKSYFLLVLITSISSCTEIFEEGSSTLINQFSSIDSTKKAIVFENAGNATVDNSLHVSIEDQEFELSNSKLRNVFIADYDHASTKLDSMTIRLAWKGNDTLNITYDSKLRIFKKLQEINGVKILYQEK